MSVYETNAEVLVRLEALYTNYDDLAREFARSSNVAGISTARQKVHDQAAAARLLTMRLITEHRALQVALDGLRPDYRRAES